MSSSSFAPVQGRAGGPRVKPGQRVVLGVLTENDHRSNQGVSTRYDAPAHEHDTPACWRSSGFGVWVAEPVKVQAPKPTRGQRSDKLHTSALQLLTAVNLSTELSWGASMPSLSEEEPLNPGAMSAEYAEEIHQYLRESELKYRSKPGYMRKQPDITNCMRVILIDWLVEVAEEYQLCSETVYLAVNYLDRFLSCMSVLRGKLQLVGTAAILLAAKYEEVYPPVVDEFVFITDDTYTRKQLLHMEHLMLKVLAFDMMAPTSHSFLMQYILAGPVCLKTAKLALYISELSLLEVDPFLHFLPSMIAAAAYCLANYTLNQALWPDSLCAFTGYTLAEIAPCLVQLHQLHLVAGSLPQQAICDKYGSRKNCSVSLIKPVKALPLR